jgi:hypothetical protein
MATTTPSKRLLAISANSISSFDTMTYGGLNVATEQYVSTQIANLVSSAPGALDTLNELAAALGDDPNFATTMTNALAGKLSTGHDMTLTLNGDASGSATFTNMGNATLSVVVANDSHTHDGRYYTETEVNSLLSGKLSTSGKAADSNLLDGLDSSRFLYTSSSIFSGDWNTLTDSNYEIQLREVQNIAGGAHSNYPEGVYTYGSVLAWQLASGTFKLYASHTGDLVFQTGWDNDGYSGWRQIWHTGNFNPASYLTTSGKAADSNLLDGLDLGGITANVANKVVRTDGNGYTNFGWINTISGNTTSTLTDIYVNTNDGYIRKATPAHFRSQITDGAYDSIGSATAVQTWVGEQNYATDAAINTAIGTVTLASLGYTGATNANYITNNNQLTNGAGYITSADGGNAQTLDGINSTSFLRSDANDTMSGVLTITGNNGVSKLRLEGTTPTIDLDDSDGDSFYIHVNSNQFYVLADRGNGGNYGEWETPHPLRLDAAANTTYLWGNLIGNAAYANTSDFDAAGSAAAVNLRIDEDVLPAIPTNNNQLTNGAGYITDGNTGWNNTYGFITNDISTGITINGSLSRGTYTTASNYATGADNIVLKGNSAGRSGIFFESEKDGTNINHPSDFAYIQYHAYGTLTSGEANELRIGVSNDADDHIIFNAPNTNGMKFRIGADATDYTVYHSGNLSLATLGYTGATNANYITNNNQLTNGAGYITGVSWNAVTSKPTSFTPSAHSHGIGEVSGLQDALDAKLDLSVNPIKAATVSNDTITFTKADNTTFAITTSDANTWRGIDDVPVNGQTAESISSNWAYDHVNASNPHGTTAADVGADAAGSAAAVDSRIDTEVLPAIGAVTLATLGYTGATNANYITNNNQLTNGAGYLTSTNDRVYITDSRGAARAPSYYNDRYAQWDFQNESDTGITAGDSWQALLTVSKWSSYNASHRQEQLIFTGDDLYRRTATSDSAWGTTKKIWDSGNLDAFVGATVSNDTITFTKANGSTVDVTTSDANTNTWRPIDDTPVDGNTTTSISSNWAFDNVKTAVPVNAVFTDTVNTFDGAYGSLTDAPTLGTASGAAIGDFATAAQGTTADAALPKAGGTVTGSILLQDSVELKFGTDTDLKMYHDGANGRIANNTGHFYIQNLSDDKDILLRGDDGSGGLETYLNIDGSLGKVSVAKPFIVTDSATITGELYTGDNLIVGDGTGDSKVVIKNFNTTSEHIEFYHGSTRVGEIGVEDTTWLRINQETNKNIYTPRYIRADAGFFVDGTTKGINGSGNFIGGTIAGASDANVTNWDTAHGWGDHDGLYDAAGSAAAVDSRIDTEVLPAIPTNNSQLTNGAGYITSYVNTQYSAGTGLDLTGTTFSIEPDLRDGITRIGKDTSNYIAIGADTNVIDFYVGGVWVARMESDGDLHMKGDVIAFSNIFNP